MYNLHLNRIINNWLKMILIGLSLFLLINVWSKFLSKYQTLILGWIGCVIGILTLISLMIFWIIKLNRELMVAGGYFTLKDSFINRRLDIFRDSLLIINWIILLPFLILQTANIDVDIVVVVLSYVGALLSVTWIILSIINVLKKTSSDNFYS
jgi:hypothetical protein